MSIQYHGASYVGLRGRNNQDSICFLENGEHALLAVVCGGIGGDLAGDVASRMAIKHMKESFLKMEKCSPDVQVKHWLQDTIQGANDLIFTWSTHNTEQREMGTTLTGILKREATTYIFNVGDSRAYRLYVDDFLALIGDHSYIADMLKHGELSEKKAAMHPNRNILTNTPDIRNSIRIDIDKIKNDYKAPLIRSNGLHGYVSEVIIREILEDKRSMEDKVRMLIGRTLFVGGYDSVSVIIVEQAGDLHEQR